jgi:imidazolonepropionase-like amidohydrolase
MNSRIFFALLVVATVCLQATVRAQDLVIANARIIVGNGSVIESGTVVVRNGRIVSVGMPTPAPAGARQIDARGMTLMPGFIDGHRHIISGNSEQWFKHCAAADAGIPRGRLHHAARWRRTCRR